MKPEVMIRRSAFREYVPGTVFNCGREGMFVLDECVQETEPGYRGNKLTMTRMSPEEETVWIVMTS